jgi:hypothetical protein
MCFYSDYVALKDERPCNGSQDGVSGPRAETPYREWPDEWRAADPTTANRRGRVRRG